MEKAYNRIKKKPLIGLPNSPIDKLKQLNKDNRMLNSTWVFAIIMDMVCNRVMKKPSLGSLRPQSKSKQMHNTS